MGNEIDEKDLTLLLTIHKNGSSSIRDLCNAVLMSSTASIAYRLNRLEELGLLAPQAKKRIARSRKLTNKGIDLLKEQRLIPGN